MYIVISPRIGIPGEPFEPTENTNIEALLATELISTDKPKKTPKVKSETSEQE